MSTIKVNRIENTSTTDGGVSIDVDGHVTIDGQQMPTAGPLSNRNLIINGAIEVSQRGTGFVDVVDIGPGHYLVDRFKAYHFAGTGGTSVIEHSQSTDAPAGFKHSYLARVKTTGMTASDGYTMLGQNIEGYNLNSLDWGSASGESVTLSFWAKSSEIGTFCVALRNDGASRAYVKTFDLNNTNWNFVSCTVPAETTGTWNSTNGVGLQLTWGLDVGTNYEGTAETWLTSNKFTTSGMTNTWTDTVNNTFQITGVQLEVGSKATPFEHESYGQTLAKCQRYYLKLQGTQAGERIGVGYVDSATAAACLLPFPAEMRTFPTALEQSGTPNDYSVATTSVNICTSVPSLSIASKNSASIIFTVSGGIGGGVRDSVMARYNSSNAFFGFSAEL